MADKFTDILIPTLRVLVYDLLLAKHGFYSLQAITLKYMSCFCIFCHVEFLGDLSVENFFKEMTHSHFPYVTSGSSSSVAVSEVPVVDNVLVRLESVQVSRAVMTLAGCLEIQASLVPISHFKGIASTNHI